VELVWYRCTSFRRSVDRDRKKERLLLQHVMRAIDRKLPLASERALVAGFRVGRDKRDEQPAVVDSLANLPIPGVAAAQLALVEPDFNATGPQCVAHSEGCFGVLRGIAQEDGPGLRADAVW
jgi:hypothetical protein